MFCVGRTLSYGSKILVEIERTPRSLYYQVSSLVQMTLTHGYQNFVHIQTDRSISNLRQQIIEMTKKKNCNVDDSVLVSGKDSQGIGLCFASMYFILFYFKNLG